MRSDISNSTGQLRKGLPDALMIALDQLARPAGLHELASATASARSSALYALRRLLDADLVSVERLRYRLSIAQQFRRGALFLAARRLRPAYGAGVAARANDGVEFAAIDGRQRLFVVYTPSVESENVVRYERLLRDAYPRVVLETFDAELLRRGTVEAVDATNRTRARLKDAEVLKGLVATTFPDRSRRGHPNAARRLRRPHATLRLLTRRQRQQLAKRYGLAEMSLFGSAVRSDFRPDSDVDVLVRLRKGVPLTLATLAGLKQELERHFRRRVDVLEESGVVEELRPLIERDKVRLYGRAHKKRPSSGAGEEVRAAGDRRTKSRRRELAR